MIRELLNSKISHLNYPTRWQHGLCLCFQCSFSKSLQKWPQLNELDRFKKLSKIQQFLKSVFLIELKIVTICFIIWPGYLLNEYSLLEFSTPFYCLWARTGAYPRMGHLKGVSLGQVHSTSANTVLTWRDLQDEHFSLFTNIRKSFYNTGPCT